jgi:hypothetical protein
LCRFFARTSLGSNQNHNLYAVSSVRAFLVGYNPFQRKLPGLSDTVCLGLFPESDSPDKRQVPEFIAKSCPRDVARGPQVRVRTLESATIDFDILKGWYAFCRDYHTRLCNPSRPVQTPMLRVIDCALREVIGADDDCSYAALSYVWGSPTSENNLDMISGRLIGRLPNVIEDAISVSLKLGIRYLWIDRYCISARR